MTSTPVEYRLDRLVAEVQDLRHELKEAISHLPKPGTRWITSTQLGDVLGLTGRCISKWVAQGRFPESSYRKSRRGGRFVYLFDRETALEAAERIIAGDSA